MSEEETTKVRFELWTVLAFLTVLAGIAFGYLFNAQAINRDERMTAIHSLDARVTRLETTFEYISEGIADLRQGQKEVKAALDDHEKNARSVKKWQDYPNSR